MVTSGGIGAGIVGATESELGQTRARIVASAFELFADRGYDGTTVDAIAERSGIARRTFFRYFRSKDDVIFPDHDALLAGVQQFLDAAHGLAPVAAVCGGVRLVFRSYVDDPAVAVERYRLSRMVPALRQREGASVSRYERAFAGYLRRRLQGFVDAPSPALRAEVTAASVVAAHNTVLRDWLREGGAAPMPRALADLDAALDYVVRLLGPMTSDERAAAEGSDGTVVAVFRAPGDFDDVVLRLRQELGDAEPEAG
jgi:AcrR family transcriptional regulator